MPEMSGKDCLMEIVKIDPSVRVLIASGFSPEDELHEKISPLVKGFLYKPFAIAELLVVVLHWVAVEIMEIQGGWRRRSSVQGKRRYDAVRNLLF